MAEVVLKASSLTGYSCESFVPLKYPMSADQVAEIAPLVREVFDHASENLTTDGVLCATFEVVGITAAWAQVTPNELNIAYPMDQSPESELHEIMQGLPASKLLSWEANKFATWSFGSTKAGEVAKVLDLLLTKLFSLGDYSLDGQLERL